MAQEHPPRRMEPILLCASAAIAPPSPISAVLGNLEFPLAGSSGGDTMPLASYSRRTAPVATPVGLDSAPHPGRSMANGAAAVDPQPLALAGWLWLWAVQSGSAATNRPDPKPALRSALEPASLLPPQFPLAQRLQLSPLALLEYTQARCHHLAQISHAAALFSHRGSVAPLATWVPVAPQGQAVLRALAQFTDGLATLPAPTAQGAGQG